MSSRGILYNLRRKIQVLAYNLTTPELVSKTYFRYLLGYRLNLDNPKTFNEKIQWLKLYYWPKSDLAIECTDKYLVRNYVQRNNMTSYLNRLIGVWNNANEINFEKLPNQFVLKCNHGCGYNIICDDKSKLNIAKTKKQLNKWLKEDFSKFNAEPHYRKITPKIICEQYLGENIIDYKFYCFEGKMQFMYIASGFGKGTDEKITFFDKNGKIAPYRRTDYRIKEDAKLPKNYKKMVEMSEILSKDFPFVRVDWFEIEDKIYFSELTFTPCGGLMKIEPKEYDEKWGKMIPINGDKNEKK